MGCGQVKLASGVIGDLMMLVNWLSISCPRRGGWSMCGEAQLLNRLPWSPACLLPVPATPAAASALLGRAKGMLEEG